MDWIGLENRLAQAIGLEASALGSTVFRQSVGRRMRARGANSVPEYMNLLDSDGDEFQALVEELVVLESWFFRHAHSFELLRRHAVSTMVVRQQPYRVLSFPCAGGEEPYSIVMALREAGLGFHQFQVDAADISEMALRKARGGNYRLRSIRVVAPDIQGRYFRIADQSVEVLTEIREAVRFIRANIIDAPCAFQGDNYDAIFCRNLLIYLTPAARRRVLQAVDGWLSPSGLFFVGHAEVLREIEGLFEPVQERGAFAFRRSPAAQAAQFERPAMLPECSRSGDQDVAPAHPPTSTKTSKSQSVKFTKSAAPDVPLTIQKLSEHKSRVSSSSASREACFDELARRVSAISSAARHPEAIEICEQHLRQNGPNPEVYHLLGMVFQAAGMYDEAKHALERAIYLDPQHEESLLSLALLARRRGEDQIAVRFEQRSQRAHDRRQPT
jgi:chemotaxis protein methyltransferase WspC